MLNLNHSSRVSSKPRVTSFLIEERSPVWLLDETSWGKWTHAAVEFTHLHAYPLTVLRKRNKNVWTAHRFIVLQDESPANSLLNMYINPDLTVMTKTTRMWGKRPRREMKQPKWAIIADSSRSPLLDLPNAAPLSRPDSCVTCRYNIAYFSILFNLLYRPFNASCSNI